MVMSRRAWKAAPCCSERLALAIAFESRPITRNGLSRRIGRLGGSGRRAGAGQWHRTGGDRGDGKSAWPLPRHGYRSTDRLFRGEDLGRRCSCCWRCGRGKRRQPRCGEVRRAGRIRIRPGEAAIRGTRGARRCGIVIRSRRQGRSWRRRSGQGAACRYVAGCGCRGDCRRGRRRGCGAQRNAGWTVRRRRRASVRRQGKIGRPVSGVGRGACRIARRSPVDTLRRRFIGRRWSCAGW